MGLAISARMNIKKERTDDRTLEVTYLVGRQIQRKAEHAEEMRTMRE